MRATQSLSDLMQDIKGDSSKWINQRGLVKGKFSWQEGYGAFSYSKSHVNSVIDYIKTKNSIIKERRLWRNILNFWRSLKLNMMKRYIFKPVDYEME